MMPKNGYNYNLLKISLERALSILGDSSKQVLLFYLTKYYGISFDGGKCSIADIESALKSILGEGSTIITDRMHKELRSMTE